MKLTIGTRELNVSSAWIERPTGLVLYILVPQTEIGHDELAKLLNENEGDITKTNDDGSVETLTGFHMNALVGDYMFNGELHHRCEVECTGEGAYQAGLALTKANAVEKENAELKVLVESQRTEIAEQKATIEENTHTIESQKAEITELNTQLSTQNGVVAEHETTINEQKNQIANLQTLTEEQKGKITELVALSDEQKATIEAQTTQISELQDTNGVLSDDMINTQMALVEVYEQVLALSAAATEPEVEEPVEEETPVEETTTE